MQRTRFIVKKTNKLTFTMIEIIKNTSSL